MINLIVVIFILLASSLSKAFNIYKTTRIHDKNKLNKKYNINEKESFKLNLMIQEAADGLSEAFVGGTVGVMSVAFYLELKKLNEKNLEGCPYCMGNGEILCGRCVGSGVIMNITTDNVGNTNSVSCICNVCSGRGLVMCINCKGDGRETPIMLLSKAVRNPEYAADGISIDSA